MSSWSDESVVRSAQDRNQDLQIVEGNLGLDNNETAEVKEFAGHGSCFASTLRSVGIVGIAMSSTMRSRAIPVGGCCDKT